MRIKEEKTTRETAGVRSVENVWWRELGWHALRASDTYIFKSTDCFQGLNAHQNWGEALQKHLHTSALFFILQPQQRLWTNVLHGISGALWKINVTNDDFFFKIYMQKSNWFLFFRSVSRKKKCHLYKCVQFGTEEQVVMVTLHWRKDFLRCENA